MRKYFTFGLILSLFSVACFAEHPQVEQLIAEKQEKMKKLEDCQGTTKKLKIAGISTLGVTAVGVIGNVAEAKVLSDTNKEVTIAKAQLKQAQEKKKKANGESGEGETNDPLNKELDKLSAEKFEERCTNKGGRLEIQNGTGYYICHLNNQTATPNIQDNIKVVRKFYDSMGCNVKGFDTLVSTQGDKTLLVNCTSVWSKEKEFTGFVSVHFDKPVCGVVGQYYFNTTKCQCHDDHELNNDKTACVPKQK